MEFNFENVFTQIIETATDAFGEGWNLIKDYAPGEFKKMSMQLIDIAENVTLHELDPSKGYSPAVGKLLLKMQLVSTESVIVAISTLVLISVQNAINGILNVLKETFVELIPFL